jgi:glycosyltransferase involved in cell wall biosynthesis
MTVSRMEFDLMRHSRTETLHSGLRVIGRASAMDPAAARSVVGLPDLPTIVALGPFDDEVQAEQLAAAFAAVRSRCPAQLVILGTGGHRATVMQRSLAQGVGSSVHAIRNLPEDAWPYLIAAADVVVPNTAGGYTSLLDVLGAGRPVVAQADPTTARLVVPASAGLIYRPGDVSGMAASLLRLLTTPALRHGMGCRARTVARRYHLQRTALLRADQGNQYA